METHEFDITIDAKGTVRVHVAEAKGAACEKYVEFFEKLLLNEASGVERTHEYYAPPSDVTIELDEHL